MKKNYLMVIIVGVTLFLLIFWVTPYFTQPVGVPLDFYDISISLDESNMEIYYIGDNIPLNKRVSYTEESTVLNIPLYNNNPYKAIIIDFSETLILNEEEITRIQSLYMDECYYIILINYTGNGLVGLIDDNDLHKDFIFLDYTTCGDLYISTSVDFPEGVEQQTIQYIITDQLEKRLE